MSSRPSCSLCSSSLFQMMPRQRLIGSKSGGHGGHQRVHGSVNMAVPVSQQFAFEQQPFKSSPQHSKPSNGYACRHATTDRDTDCNNRLTSRNSTARCVSSGNTLTALVSPRDRSRNAMRARGEMPVAGSGCKAARQGKHNRVGMSWSVARCGCAVVGVEGKFNDVGSGVTCSSRQPCSIQHGKPLHAMHQ
jgi:hypothetical protein